jgi:hypothetical protein
MTRSCAVACLALVACSRPDTHQGDIAPAATPSASTASPPAEIVAPSASTAAAPATTPCASLMIPAAVDAGVWGLDVGSTMTGHLGSVPTTSKPPGSAPSAWAIGIGPVAPQGAGGSLGPHGRLSEGHVVASPTVRSGSGTASGGLSWDVAARVPRQNFGRFRLCYEEGLRKDPKLAGAVVARFTIDAEGAVSKATADPCTTMPDQDVTSCVLRGVSSLKYPKPEGGEASVVFPVLFAPE